MKTDEYAGKTELEIYDEYVKAGKPGSKSFDDEDICSRCGKIDHHVNAVKNTRAMFDWRFRDAKDLKVLTDKDRSYLCGDCQTSEMKRIDKELGMGVNAILASQMIEIGLTVNRFNMKLIRALKGIDNDRIPLPEDFR
jgi:hypothetical protein